MKENKKNGCQFTVEDIYCGYIPYDGLIHCSCDLLLCDYHYMDHNNGEHEGHDQASQLLKRSYV